MRSLKQLLPERQPIVGGEADEQTVFFVCRRVIQEEFGARGSENITPAVFREKKLYVSSAGSLWTSEVLLRKRLLQARINAVLGAETVLDIRVRKPA